MNYNQLFLDADHYLQSSMMDNSLDQFLDISVSQHQQNVVLEDWWSQTQRPVYDGLISSTTSLPLLDSPDFGLFQEQEDDPNTSFQIMRCQVS